MIVIKRTNALVLTILCISFNLWNIKEKSGSAMQLHTAQIRKTGKPFVIIVLRPTTSEVPHAHEAAADTAILMAVGVVDLPCMCLLLHELF